MRRTDAFRVEGVVTQAFPNGTWEVALANGHRLRGFVAGRPAREVARFAPGDRVNLCLTPYDLSSGRILVETED